MKSLWNGLLSFGLINIPVKLYSASHERSLSFRMLDRHDLCPVSFTKVCRSDNRIVPQSDIVKGYEYKKEHYIVLTPADFKRANARRTGIIEILYFTDSPHIDERYYDKPYYLEPDRKVAKAYSLLIDVMNETERMAVVRFVLRDREHIGLLKADRDILILLQLRYSDEIINPEEIDVPDSPSFSPAEKRSATMLVQGLTHPFNPEDFHDNYTDELKRIITEKAKGIRLHQKSKELPPTPSDSKELLSLLEKSLEYIKEK